jgi:hypothetical protein
MDKINNTLSLEKIKKPLLECEVSPYLISKHAYINNFINPYLKKPLHNKNDLIELGDETSDANIYKVLSFEKSIREYNPDNVDDEEWVHTDDSNLQGYICDLQASRDNYFDNNRLIKFPDGAINIPINQFTNYHLYITRFPHLKAPTQRRLILKNETDDAIRLEACAKLTNVINKLRYPLLYPDDINIDSDANDEFRLLQLDVIEHKKEILETKPEGYTTNQWIRKQFGKETDNHVLNQFNYIWNPDRNINTAMKKITKWEQENSDRMLLYNLPKPIDTSLSLFANMTYTCMMNKYEKISVVNLHGTLQLAFITSLGALNANNQGIHTHMGYAGPPSGGKSFSLDRLADILLIPGTFYKIARLTPQAFSTGTNFSNMVFIFHEIANVYLGYNELTANSKVKDQGDAQVKQILSGESSTILSAHTDSNGKRITIETTVNQRFVLLGAMNLPIYLMAVPIRHRWYMKDIPKKERTTKSLALTRLEKHTNNMSGDLFHQFIQCISGKIFHLIKVGIIPDVNVDVALILFNDVLQKLGKYGFKTNESRDLDRLINCAKTLTIINAIYTCFLYNKIISTYEVTNEFLHIQDYLVCTEEIAIFTLTALADMFLSNTEYNIINHTISLFAPSTDMAGYICYSVPLCKYKSQEDVLNVLTVKIKKDMVNTKTEYSEGMIMNVFLTLVSRRFKSNNEIMRIDTSTGTIYLLQEYCLALSQYNYEQLMIQLIKDTVEHKYLKQKRVMTGYIENDNFPDVYKVIELTPNDKIKKLVNGVILDEMEVDEYFLKEHLKETGYLNDYEMYKHTLINQEIKYPDIIFKNKKRNELMTCSEYIDNKKLKT